MDLQLCVGLIAPDVWQPAMQQQQQQELAQEQGQ
jgi:hypothetical protein